MPTFEPIRHRAAWALWFVAIIIAPFTPLLSPAGDERFWFGLPASLLIWLAFTLVLAGSIIVFVITAWPEND
jgi:hypothetical protein